jgi:glycogen operon protein
MSKKAVERPLHNCVAELAERTEVRRAGVPLPLGTHEDRGGVIFASFSRHAGHVRLELFGLPGRGNAHPTIDLDRGRTARVTCGSVGA